MKTCLIALLLLAVPLPLWAAGPEVAFDNVRRAPSLKMALHQVKGLPQVRAALQQHKEIVLATRKPTEQEISHGKMLSMSTGQPEKAGYAAQLVLYRNLLGQPALKVHFTSKWLQYSQPSVKPLIDARGLPNQLEAWSKAVDRAEQAGSYTLLDGQKGTRLFKISTRTFPQTKRNTRNIKLAEEAFELTPDKLADLLNKAL